MDAHDKNIWNKSTILDIKEQAIDTERTIKVVYVAFRYYLEKGSRSDEKGRYEGYSNKYDEWIAMYSPRIMPLLSKTQRSFYDDYEVDDDFDNL